MAIIVWYRSTSNGLHHYHHQHQFLSPAIWRRWVQMNDLHCRRLLVKSIASVNVSAIDSVSSFTLSVHPSLPFFPFPLNLAYYVVSLCENVQLERRRRSWKAVPIVNTVTPIVLQLVQLPLQLLH